VIGRLRGILVEREASTALVECAGVGYEVAVSGTTAAALPATGGEVTLRVYTHVQQDRIALFGFASAEERELFDLLITVKGVGPSLAMGILSGSDPGALARMIADANLAGLTSIRKVGKKVAERLVVELREGCASLLVGWGRPATDGRVRITPPRTLVRPPILDDVASALVNLGLRPAAIDKIVGQLEVTANTTIESLLRDALRAIPR
jgi:Holliday junction DNA helicase RuvA